MTYRCILTIKITFPDTVIEFIIGRYILCFIRIIIKIFGKSTIKINPCILMCESSLKPQISNKILCGQRGIQAVLPCRTVHDTKSITAFTEIYAIIQFNHYTTLPGRKSKACNLKPTPACCLTFVLIIILLCICPVVLVDSIFIKIEFQPRG